MAIHINDPETEATVRKLAAQLGTTLTGAVRKACTEALQLELRNRPLKERLESIYQLVEAAPPTGEVADKAFFDELWGDQNGALGVGATEVADRDIGVPGGSAPRVRGRSVR